MIHRCSCWGSAWAIFRNTRVLSPLVGIKRSCNWPSKSCSEWLTSVSSPFYLPSLGSCLEQHQRNLKKAVPLRWSVPFSVKAFPDGQLSLFVQLGCFWLQWVLVSSRLSRGCMDRENLITFNSLPYLDPTDPFFQTVGVQLLKEVGELLHSHSHWTNPHLRPSQHSMSPHTTTLVICSMKWLHPSGRFRLTERSMLMPMFFTAISTTSPMSMQVSCRWCERLIQMLFGRSTPLWRHPSHFSTRVMQAWLFLSDFWTADRVKSYLSKVPIVRHVPVRLRSIETGTRSS